MIVDFFVARWTTAEPADIDGTVTPTGAVSGTESAHGEKRGLHKRNAKERQVRAADKGDAAAFHPSCDHDVWGLWTTGNQDRVGRR